MRDAAAAAAAANDLLVESVVRLDDVLDDAGVSAGAAADALNDMRDAGTTAGGAARVLAGEANDLRDALAGAGLATTSLNLRFGSLAGKAGLLTGALGGLDAELDKKRAALGAVAFDAAALALAMGALRDRTAVSGAAAAATATSYRLLGTGIRLTGTAIHWLIAGFAELAAVVIPAAVAAGAWAAAWLQGTVNVVQHMDAVYTATEAMANAGARTAGQMVGLGDALQKAQNQANPQVYQALGGAIDLVKESTGGLAEKGVQVGAIFDRFLGRVVYDFSAAGGAGKQLNSVMASMIPDLTEIGQVFGNLGHAVLLLAAQMPGLSQVLLAGIAGFTDLARVILQLTSDIHLGSWSVLTFAIALEEFARWGGLLVGVMGRMGIATTALRGNFSSLGGFIARFGSVALNLVRAPLMLASQALAGVGNVVSRLPGLFGEAGAAVEVFGVDLGIVAAEMTALQAVGILAAVAALGFLAYKFATAKSAAEQFAGSLQQAVTKASALDVLPVLASGLAQLGARAAQASGQYQKLSAGMTDTAASSRTLGAGLAASAGAWTTYTAAQTKMVAETANVVTGARQIASAYGISVPAAMALAASAGVNLTGKLKTQGGAWTALGQQVRNAYRGYVAMGQSAGQIGHDMLAVAIQAGLAGTKVSALNQAWDQFMQDITGGTGALAGFETSLQNIGQVAGTGAKNLATYTATMSLSTRQFAQQLTHFTGEGASAWTNFDQILGSTLPQMADWFRVAGAEGALGAHGTNELNKAILDMASQMVPFAAKSKTAQAELIAFAQSQGLNIKTFAQLQSAIRSSGASEDDLAKKTGAVTVAMGNMAQIAQNLGDVMAGQVTAAISAAALKATGFTTDVNNLTTAMAHGSAGGHNAAYWAAQTAQAYTRAGDMAQTAAGKVAGLARAQSMLHSQTITITTRMVTETYGSGGTLPGTGGGHRIIGGNVLPGKPGGSGGNVTVHVNVAGSVQSEQGIVRAVQAGLNRKTLRNGSTQAFIPGRRH
jgi:hypothetical protein